MDFGFGDFLNKFEKHFGARALKGLLLLIGLAVALFCSKMIWQIALGPLVVFIVTTVSSGQWLTALAEIFWLAAAAAAGVGLASLISANLLYWRSYKKGQELLNRTDALHERVQKYMAETTELLDKAEATTGASKDVMEQVATLRDEAVRLVELAKGISPSDPPQA